jgi:glycosyltransferase involved in cell wall biosynthesis
MAKKKILFAGEATYLNSGYSHYSKELMERLFKLDKYEMAEFASYGNCTDPRVRNIPWKYYANMPEQYEQEALKIYKTRTTNEFGHWRFDRVLLDFKPDIVIDIRDFWMNAYQRYSPLRPYFSWLLMPTVDSTPQVDDWIDTYITAEGVLTYTEWSKNILDKESGGSINTLGAAPFGVDYDIFSPAKDKAAHKESFGISGNSFIVGTVMRNQKRKLFPDLMQAFAKALDKMAPEVAKRTYLYLHTSYPDKACWDLPTLIKENGIGSRVLVSYICRACKKTSVAIFQDARTQCPHCKNTTCVMPSVGFGHNIEQLVDVYRLFDLYVQYSICEGFGLPQVEAAACGVNVASVDYSAMEDIVKRLGGYPIPVERFFREFESHAYRAYPDNNALANYIAKQVGLQQKYREKQSLKIRESSQSYFNWEQTAKIWEAAIDGLAPPKRKWTDPIGTFQPAAQPPDGLSNAEFVKWLMNEVYPFPECNYNLMGLGVLRDLNFGATATSKGMEPIDRKKVYEKLVSRTREMNIAEEARCGVRKLQEENYIRFANNREIKHV